MTGSSALISVRSATTKCKADRRDYCDPAGGDGYPRRKSAAAEIGVSGSIVLGLNSKSRFGVYSEFYRDS